MAAGVVVVSMRAVWVDAGNDPDYAKLQANGITWPYFDIRDQRLTPTYLDGVKAHPHIDGIGVYAVRGTHSWVETDTLTPAQFAEWVDARLKAIGWLGNPVVMLDIEGMTNLVDFLIGTLIRWRELRPKRTTDLTIEGHKGGLFSEADAREVAKRVRWTVPQAYDGGMHPWDSWGVFSDLYAVGFAALEIVPFYDAATLLPWWGIPDGFAFTQGRLP